MAVSARGQAVASDFRHIEKGSPLPVTRGISANPAYYNACGIVISDTFTVDTYILVIELDSVHREAYD